MIYDYSEFPNSYLPVFNRGMLYIKGIFEVPSENGVSVTLPEWLGWFAHRRLPKGKKIKTSVISVTLW